MISQSWFSRSFFESICADKVPGGGTEPLGAGKNNDLLFFRDTYRSAGIPLPLQDTGWSMRFGVANAPVTAEQ